MSRPLTLLLVALAACGTPPDELETVTVRLPSVAVGTPADPALFEAATAPRPSAEPIGRWDTLWTALGETPLDSDGMTRAGPFPPAVAALDGADLTVTGYMMPLDASAAPRRFLLVGVPLADCAFCIPRGPAGAVEVLAAEGVPGTYEPITLHGCFHVLADDPDGLLFRLTDATLP